jgi:poly-gamma-glutamate synthesis protein (capsule biosynthesis protein)
VLKAIRNVELNGGSWHWLLVESAERADILLEASDIGIPAGVRSVALTVPFDMLWDSVTVEEAESIVATGHQDVALMDWAEMSATRRALRIDGLLPSEEGYPLQQAWALVAKEGFESAAIELGPHLSRSINEDQLFHLTAVGDLMLDRAIGYALQNGDLSFPFGLVADELRQADLTVGNLESSLGDIGQPASKSYTFQAPVPAADALANAGFDLLSLANNHAMDYGPESLQQAQDLLALNGIATVGAGANAQSAHKPYTIEHDGLTVSFLSYVDVPVEVSGFDTGTWTATELQSGLAWADAAAIQEDVTSADNDSDIVIVLLHSGYEYVQAPSPEQMRAARTAVDAGADLVIGHHAHILQGVEFNGDSVIFYGLGNFAFEIDGDPTTAILNLWLDTGGVRQFELIPAIIESGGRPRIATSWEAPEIRQRVYYLSRLLND